MEQGDILSSRFPGLTPEEIQRRFARLGPPGRRSSSSLLGPRPEAGDSDSGPEGGGRPRGDHDLNPDLYDPKRSLVPAAVLVPIVARRAGPTVLLTRRTDHLDSHAGQISFPGGRIEPQDEGPIGAALREAEEEVGLPAERVRVVGELDRYVVRTGFEITPVVGLVTPPFPVRPDSFEVAEVFEVPLEFLLVPANAQRHSRDYQGRTRHFYVFPYKDYYIWGATAGMLVNLREVLTGASLRIRPD